MVLPSELVAWETWMLPDVRTEPPGREERGLQLLLAPVQVHGVLKVLDLFAPIGVEHEKLVARPIIGGPRFASDELAVACEEENHYSGCRLLPPWPTGPRVSTGT